MALTRQPGWAGGERALMTEIVTDVGSLTKTIKKTSTTAGPAGSTAAEQATVRELVSAARARGET